LSLSKVLGLFLHSKCFCLSRLSQILSLNTFIFCTHQLSFTPFFESLCIIQSFVSSE
jgi:hypothetical protein